MPWNAVWFKCKQFPRRLLSTASINCRWTRVGRSSAKNPTGVTPILVRNCPFESSLKLVRERPMKSTSPKVYTGKKTWWKSNRSNVCLAIASNSTPREKKKSSNSTRRISSIEKFSSVETPLLVHDPLRNTVNSTSKKSWLTTAFITIDVLNSILRKIDTPRTERLWLREND